MNKLQFYFAILDPAEVSDQSVLIQSLAVLHQHLPGTGATLTRNVGAWLDPATETYVLEPSFVLTVITEAAADAPARARAVAAALAETWDQDEVLVVSSGPLLCASVHRSERNSDDS